VGKKQIIRKRETWSSINFSILSASIQSLGGWLSNACGMIYRRLSYSVSLSFTHMTCYFLKLYSKRNMMYGTLCRSWVEPAYVDSRARNFKLLRSPGIDSKRSILPAYVAWRAGDNPILTRFLTPVDCLKIPEQSRCHRIYHGQPLARVDFIPQSGTKNLACRMSFSLLKSVK
jgi:hypothetical protein